MALWGNNDSKGSGGTLTLDYTTLVVTGSGTTFGNVGAAATGDVIRFGSAFGVNFGDAVVVGIASTTQLSIASFKLQLPYSPPTTRRTKQGASHHAGGGASEAPRRPSSR